MRVIIPEITMDKPLIAPSTSPNCMARAVPIAWEDVPIAIPFATGCVMPVTLQMISQKIFQRTPVRIITATVIVTFPPDA